MKTAIHITIVVLGVVAVNWILFTQGANMITQSNSLVNGIGIGLFMAALIIDVAALFMAYTFIDKYMKDD